MEYQHNLCDSQSLDYIRLYFAYIGLVLDPDAALPRTNRTLVYLGARIIAGLRFAREKQVNVRVVPTSHAIDESVDLAHEIFQSCLSQGARQV
jgi:hypothetical protein